MELVYGHNGQKVPLEDLQWFLAKSKVSISLAVTEYSSFFDGLKEGSFLSEEESLELQADKKSVHQIVYDCLCRIEEKPLLLQHFFWHLLQKPLRKQYPDLKPIYKEYKEGKYKKSALVSSDMDKDRMTFTQDKVKICLAVTDLFPFVHGLQDLTFLSEVESLKLQADRRPVSRVIYECLSLIEKKDMKLSIVFEYIFQECYLKLYPGLQEILQEPGEEQVELFVGWKHCSEYMQNVFQVTKTGICQAINELFPFIYGLHDVGLLSRIELLTLQADKRPTKDVLYEALSFIEQKNEIEALCAYVFCEFYIKLFPPLKVILRRLKEAIMLDKNLPSADSITSPGHIKKSKDRRDSPDPEKHKAADNSKPLSQNGPAPKRALHSSPTGTGLPEKMPLVAGPSDIKTVIKIYKCDYGHCRRAFSNLSKFKAHKSKHKGPKEKDPIWQPSIRP
ncbi:uncharacterized protein LOC120924423 [Rana temporaria]|uniref:uncharacterized protein LOC120924423 n=1 Tax=Rana temporaria TaxID=8407 RepID=UPI001AADC950|nr:uncharacterized protein LOC120924423 [Rana temporaria]